MTFSSVKLYLSPTNIVMYNKFLIIYITLLLRGFFGCLDNACRRNGVRSLLEILKTDSKSPNAHWLLKSRTDSTSPADSPVQNQGRQKHTFHTRWNPRTILTDRSWSPSCVPRISVGPQCSPSLSFVEMTWSPSLLTSIFHRMDLVYSRACPQEDRAPWTFAFRNTWTQTGSCITPAQEGQFLGSTCWDLLHLWKLLFCPKDSRN